MGHTIVCASLGPSCMGAMVNSDEQTNARLLGVPLHSADFRYTSSHVRLTTCSHVIDRLTD
jgi:hypothetical protein